MLLFIQNCTYSSVCLTAKHILITYLTPVVLSLFVHFNASSGILSFSFSLTLELLRTENWRKLIGKQRFWTASELGEHKNQKKWRNIIFAQVIFLKLYLFIYIYIYRIPLLFLHHQCWENVKIWSKTEKLDFLPFSPE